MHWFLGGSIKERRLRTASLLAVAVGLLFAALISFYDPLESAQRLLIDAQFAEQDGSPNIVLVAIDDAALDRHGRVQQWPRTLHADAIRNLNEAGARVVVYDILFADRGVDDEALADVIAQSGNVILPVAGGGSSSVSEGRLIYESVSLPVESLLEAGAVVAHVNLTTDSDGRVRRTPVVVGSRDGEQYPSLALAATYLQFGRRPPADMEIKEDSLQLFGRSVPLEEHQTLRVNYLGGEERFSGIPFDAVLDNSFETESVRNTIVIVGVTAAGFDNHSAPLLESATGLEIHANALDTILRARFLRPASDWVTLGTVLLFVVLASVILPRQKLGYSLAFVMILVAAYLVIGVYMFRQGHILDFVDPPAALVLLTVVALAYRAVSERASQRELQELFGRYVSPQVASELVERADRGDLHLGGELREVTVMFADLRGFTRLAERMEPAELVELLNAYFEVIVSEVMNHQGIVNKFAGDEVMALWNAPKEQEDHAFLACCAAVAAQRRLQSLAPSEPIARFGFGIHSGVALAGNVGAIGRLEYTVIGESVNLAARLCQAAGPGEIWVSDQTFRLLKNKLAAEPQPPQHLKGIEAPTAVYSIKWHISGQGAKVRA